MQQVPQQNKKRENKKMICLTSWDDGSKEDLRIAELLQKYELDGTFFIPTNCELTVKNIRELSEDFNIGGHTVNHPVDMKKLNKEQLRDEILPNKTSLEAITRKKVIDFCYPRGRYNEETIEVLKECGFKTARTTLVANTFVPEDKFRIKSTVHAYPYRKEYGHDKWYEYAKKAFLVAKEDGYFHLWGHSWEIEKFRQWKRLEDVLQFIKDNKD